MSAGLKVPPEFDALPGDEQVAFVQDLWDRIAEHPERIGIPEEHKRILDERLGAYVTDPRAGRPWAEVRDELLAKRRR